MIQYDETRLAMEALTPQIEELKGALNLEGLKIKVDELEMKSTEPNFWDDPEKAQAVQQQIGQYKNTIDSFNRMKTNHDDVLAMIELAEKVKSEFEEQKLATLLTGEYDSSNAILTFHAGAGGTEAQDWVSMLLRMYMKWADRHGFKTEILDMLDGEEAGIKSASIHIQGFNAYGFLKSENGVHRLVRVSPFDAQGRCSRCGRRFFRRIRWRIFWTNGPGWCRSIPLTVRDLSSGTWMSTVRWAMGIPSRTAFGCIWALRCCPPCSLALNRAASMSGSLLRSTSWAIKAGRI